MRVSSVLWQIAIFLVYPAAILTVVLYTYPVFLGCGFPLASKPQVQCMLSPETQQPSQPKANIAPFRLLVIGDPQLEGDSSLPDSTGPTFPGLASLTGLPNAVGFLEKTLLVKQAFKRTFQKDLPRVLKGYRKRLDLWGNDRYLAHIYRTVKWWVDPTHITVLGDLLGSQWVNDDEFERRASRFWDTVFAGGARVEDAVAEARSTEILGEDPAWKNRIINVVGNHDIGYSGDLNRHRLERFEKAFGKANWDQRFLLRQNSSGSGSLPENMPELRLVVLNSMNLDGPPLDYDMMKETYDYVNNVLQDIRPVEQTNQAIVLLTHVPLHKRAGLCSDAPYIAYNDQGVREQNHLSQEASKSILGGLFGKSGSTTAPNRGIGRNGVILTGHDHNGCDVYHYVQKGSDLDGGDFTWEAALTPFAQKYTGDRSIPGVREITMRSIMGDFSGYTGLLSGWFDEEENEWKFAFAPCPFAVQHLWWAVHVFDIVVAILFVAYGVSIARENNVESRKAASAHPKTPSKRKSKRPPSTPRRELTPNGSALNGSASSKSLKKARSNGHLDVPENHGSARKGRSPARSPKKKS